MRLMLLVLTCAAPAAVLFDADVIAKSLEAAGIQKSKIKLWTDVDRTLFQRWLNGEGNLPHHVLGKLPVRFWQWYALHMAQRVGLPQEVRRAMPLALATMAAKRMAKAPLRQPVQEKEKAS